MRRFGCFGIVLIAAVSAMLGGCSYVARQTLTTGPNGPETPASVGVPFERISIASSGRRLDAYLVPPAAGCTGSPAIVIYHGLQETISMYVKAQKLLSENCVASLVFDYTGSGDSSRGASMQAVNQDATAVYDFARSRFAGDRLFLLGHSMGNGILFASIPRFSSQPEGVIAANMFSSLRDMAGRSAWYYRILMKFSPDWWNNRKAVAGLHAPLLVISSDADTTAPAQEARQVFEAANEPKKFVVLHGFRHNALYLSPQQAWWGEVLRFVGAPAPGSTN